MHHGLQKIHEMCSFHNLTLSPIGIQQSNWTLSSNPNCNWGEGRDSHLHTLQEADRSICCAHVIAINPWFFKFRLNEGYSITATMGPEHLRDFFGIWRLRWAFLLRSIRDGDDTEWRLRLVDFKTSTALAASLVRHRSKLWGGCGANARSYTEG